jgi:2-dehydropantoate 2-reductase
MRAACHLLHKRTGDNIHRIAWRLIKTRSLSSSPNPSPSEKEIVAPKVFVLGSGPIGFLLAASLRNAFPEYPVRLLLRESSILLRSLERRTEVSISLEERFKVPPPKDANVALPIDAKAGEQSSSSTESTKRRTNPRLSRRKASSPYVLLTTKAHQAIKAVESMRHLVDHKCTIIVMCNGALAVAEELRKMDLPGLIYTAFSTHVVYRESTNDPAPHIVHAGYGEIVLLHCSTLALFLDACGLNARSIKSDTEMEYLLWQKLAADAVVNPLTALYQCPNGALYDAVPQFASHYLPGIVDEVAAVYRAISGDAPTPAPPDERLFLDYVVDFIKKTASNHSSSYQDVLHECQPSEIHYLTGYVLRHAAAHNIDCPIQTELYQRLFPPDDTMDDDT